VTSGEAVVTTPNTGTWALFSNTEPWWSWSKYLLSLMFAGQFYSIHCVFHPKGKIHLLKRCTEEKKKTNSSTALCFYEDIPTLHLVSSSSLPYFILDFYRWGFRCPYSDIEIKH
jgi:hypothetical protein